MFCNRSKVDSLATTQGPIHLALQLGEHPLRANSSGLGARGQRWIDRGCTLAKPLEEGVQLLLRLHQGSVRSRSAMRDEVVQLVGRSEKVLDTQAEFQSLPIVLR